MRRSVTIVALCVSPRSQMDFAKSPSDIARETLKLLATRRLTPSPDNYRALYEEVAGTRSAPQFPATQLRQILRVMPCQTPGQKRQAELLEKAIAQQDWSMLQNVLVGYAKLGLAPAPVPPVHSASIDHLPHGLAQNLVRMVENALPALGEDDPRIHELAAQLIAFLREPTPP